MSCYVIYVYIFMILCHMKKYISTHALTQCVSAYMCAPFYISICNLILHSNGIIVYYPIINAYIIITVV